MSENQKCKVAGCPTPTGSSGSARGLCSKHYRWTLRNPKKPLDAAPARRMVGGEGRTRITAYVTPRIDRGTRALVRRMRFDAESEAVELALAELLGAPELRPKLKPWPLTDLSNAQEDAVQAAWLLRMAKSEIRVRVTAYVSKGLVARLPEAKAKHGLTADSQVVEHALAVLIAALTPEEKKAKRRAARITAAGTASPAPEAIPMPPPEGTPAPPR